ncbi:CAP domain-containing protein [Streptomyces naphthomycinicus]|uniref:CAP domain-containing protein n=1 Tax=Streptomyces naphthomycinicus TaxID=2872625 RepID=UPI001CEC8096|nr:CAP domain-containing protein [Streptomyces sp. TML10]
MKPNYFATAIAAICGLVFMGPTSTGSVLPRADSAPAAGESSPVCRSGPPPGTGSQISAADAADMVRAHNDARREAIKKYNPGLPMVSVDWDPKLACDAQAWADDPASSQDGKRHHSDRADNGDEGENLFSAYPGPARPMSALDPSLSYSWIAEKPKFDADNNASVTPDNRNVWGHYSQMIWMSPASPTTAIGCGVKEGVPVADDTGQIHTGYILVCRYSAAGNIDGQRAVPTGGGPVVPTVFADDWTAKGKVAADAVGDPATFVWGNSQQHVFYRSKSGAIKHLFWDAPSNKVYADDWTAKANAAADAAGDPSAFVWGSTQQHVFYRSTNGAIKHLFWDAPSNKVYAEDWTAKANVAADAVGDPSTFVWGGSQQHVFYRSKSGAIKHLFWDAPSNKVYADDWTAKANVAADAASDPSTFVWGNAQQHVFYRSAGGAVKHLFWDAPSNKVYADDWTAKANVAADAVGDPSTFVWGNAQQHVFYRSAGGAVKHLFWDAPSNKVYADDWTAKANVAADAASDPSTFVWGNAQQHVFYRSTGGAVKHLFWDAPSNKVYAENWTAKANVAADAVGDPSTFVWGDAQQHVFYRSNSGAIEHLFWNAK